MPSKNSLVSCARPMRRVIASWQSLSCSALHTTNGRWDIIVELGVESLEAFDQSLQRIRLIKGISNSETSLLLSTHKN
jgi:DNA-binding Lrp family transcriptional regulator